MVADVVVENASYSFDIPFSYRVPGRMEGQIRPGCRVLVPFGRSNRSKQGLVLRLQPQDPQSQQLKPIKMLLDQKPLLGEEQLWLLELLHQRTFCTYYEGLRALVPSGLTFRLKLMRSLGEARPQQPTDKQRQLLDYLSAKKKPVELEHLPIYLSEVDELEEDTPEHSPREAVSLNEALAAYEKKLILAAMKASNWKIVDAAARLRIPRTSLQYKLEKYDIKRR